MPNDDGGKERASAPELHSLLLSKYTTGTIIDYLEWGQSQMPKSLWGHCIEKQDSTAPVEIEATKKAFRAAATEAGGAALPKIDKAKEVSSIPEERSGITSMVCEFGRRGMLLRREYKLKRLKSFVVQLDEVCRRMGWGDPFWTREPESKSSRPRRNIAAVKVRNATGRIAIACKDRSSTFHINFSREAVARQALERFLDYEDEDGQEEMVG